MEEAKESLRPDVEEAIEGAEKAALDPFAIISPFFQIGGMIGFALFLFLLGKGIKALGLNEEADD